MRFKAIIFCALLCALGGCASSSMTQRAALSQSHLEQIDHFISDAMAHLDAARRITPADARLGPELDGGARSLNAAHQLVPLLRQDVAALGDAAVSLQKQIDDHRNDLLGPRGKRIRNRIIILAVLLGIGAALLQFGPLIGGPFGGLLIVAGHVLTAFAVPLFDGALTLLRKILATLITWPGRIYDFLDKLASAAVSTTTAVATAIAPTAATVGSSNSPEGSAAHAPVAAD